MGFYMKTKDTEAVYKMFLTAIHLRLILEHLVAERGGVEIATVHCSAHTEPRDVIATLKKVTKIFWKIKIKNKIKYE